MSATGAKLDASYPAFLMIIGLMIRPLAAETISV
jgi:hypothetical protein